MRWGQRATGQPGCRLSDEPATPVFIYVVVHKGGPVYFAISEGIAVQAAQGMEWAAGGPTERPSVHRLPFDRWVSLGRRNRLYGYDHRLSRGPKDPGPWRKLDHRADLDEANALRAAAEVSPTPTEYPKPEAQLGYVWATRSRQRIAVFTSHTLADAKTKHQKNPIFGIWQDGFAYRGSQKLIVRGWIKGRWRWAIGADPNESLHLW